MILHITKTNITKKNRGEEMKLSREKINLQLARKCWTVQRLADAYGVSRNRINVLLNQREVSTASAGRLAAALGVDVTEILED